MRSMLSVDRQIHHHHIWYGPSLLKLSHPLAKEGKTTGKKELGASGKFVEVVQHEPEDGVATINVYSGLRTDLDHLTLDETNVPLAVGETHAVGHWIVKHDLTPNKA